jgi:hypothetical protein
MLSDDLVAEAVNEKVEAFYRNVRTRRVAADGSLGQIAVLFTQKRSKKTWFSSTEVRRCPCIALRSILMPSFSIDRNKYLSRYI